MFGMEDADGALGRDRELEQQARANELKETLVRFDAESSSRTTVIDDQGEYYELVKANAWLGDEEREEALRAAAEEGGGDEGGRRGAVRVDLLGRRFYEAGGGDEGGDEGGLGLGEAFLGAVAEERPWGGARGMERVGEEGRGRLGESVGWREFLKDDRGG